MFEWYTIETSQDSVEKRKTFTNHDSKCHKKYKKPGIVSVEIIWKLKIIEQKAI